MKKAIRFLCLLLAIVMCTGILASCGGDDPDTTTTQRPIGGGEEKWDGVSFEGETLRIEYNSYEQGSLAATGSPHYYEKFIKGPDSASSDSVDNAVFERNELVTDRLGMTVEWREDKTASVTELFSHFENVIGAGNAPHIVINMNYGLVRAEVNGLLYNLKSNYGDYSKNLFSFEGEDGEGWYYDMMLDTTLNKDRVYIAAGDYLIDPLRLSYNTFVNVDLFEELYSKSGGMDYLYDMILAEGGDWTYDTYIDMNDRATDQTSPKQEDWIYGTASNNYSYRAFFFSSGLTVFDYDADGKPSYINDPEKLGDLHTYVDKIMSVLGAVSVAGPKQNFDATKAFDIFKNGRALFMTDQFLAALEGETFRNMDYQTAVIPYPKYDYEADYRILVSDNSCSGGILVSSYEDEFTMASAFLQMMTEESDDVLYEYFEKGLKFKNNSANSPKQVEVLDVIRDAVAEPIDFLFDNFASRETKGTHSNNTNSHTIYDIIEVAVNNNSNTFSSLWDSEVGAKNNTLRSTVNKFYSN